MVKKSQVRNSIITYYLTYLSVQSYLYLNIKIIICNLVTACIKLILIVVHSTYGAIAVTLFIIILLYFRTI